MSSLNATKGMKEIPKFEVGGLVLWKVTRSKCGMQNVCQTLEFAKSEMREPMICKTHQAISAMLQ